MATSVLRFNELSKCKYFVEASVFLVFSILINRLGIENKTSLLTPKVYSAPFDVQLNLHSGFYLLQGVTSGPNALKRFRKLSSIAKNTKISIDQKYPITIFSDDPFLALFDASFELDIHDPYSWRLAITKNELRRRGLIAQGGSYSLYFTINEEWNYSFLYDEKILVEVNAEEKKIVIHEHYLTTDLRQAFTRTDRHSLNVITNFNLTDIVSLNEGRVIIQC